MGKFWCCGLVFLCLVTGVGSVGAEILSPPRLIHPTDDGRVFEPGALAFWDSNHLIMTYEEKEEESDGSRALIGQFVRSLNMASNELTAPVAIELSDGRGAFGSIELGGSDGHVRMVFAVETDEDLGGYFATELYIADVGSGGTIVGTPVLVTSKSGIKVFGRDVAVLNDGRALVAWVENDTSDARRYRVRGRLFDSSLTPEGDDFKITKDNEKALGVSLASNGSTFAATWLGLKGADIFTRSPLIVALNANGARRWHKHINGPAGVLPLPDSGIPDVAVLANGSVVVAYPRDDKAGTQSHRDVFARVYTAAGDLVGDEPRDPNSGFYTHGAYGEYRITQPRVGIQDWVRVSAAGNVAEIANLTAWQGSRQRGSLDRMRLDSNSAPVDADAPIIDNNLVPRSIAASGSIGMASRGKYTAITYSSDPTKGSTMEEGGSTAKLIVLRSGVPRCPSDVGDCGAFVPFTANGSAGSNLNVVLRPSSFSNADYGTTVEGKRLFLRELRDQLLLGVRYGASQHQSFYDKFNFFYWPDNAEMSESVVGGFGCVGASLSAEEYMDFSMQYAWVHAVGAQLAEEYFDQEWCALPQSLPSGAGQFHYPGERLPSTFAHELSHALYSIFDEYDGGQFLEDKYPGAFQSQYLTLDECRADALAEGWNLDDCHLRCDGEPNECSSLCQNVSLDTCWYSAEPNQRGTFYTLEECNEWRTNSASFGYAECWNTFDRFFLPELKDLMGNHASDGGTGDSETDLTVGIVRPNLDLPRPSFQRACERKALYIHDLLE